MKKLVHIFISVVMLLSWALPCAAAPFEKTPEKAMFKAVQGMLPHTKLGRQMIKKLRVYAGSEHENAAQKPEVWEVK